MIRFGSKVYKQALSEYLKSSQAKKTAMLHTSAIIESSAGGAKGSYIFPESQEDFETSTAEWEYVERLFPLKHTPVPNVKPGTVLPSGWTSPSAKRQDYPYFVMRSRSHFFRLYKNSNLIEQRICTKLKGIEGDVILLADELKQYLQHATGKKLIKISANEAFGIISITGDYVNPVEEFLKQKGF